MDNTSFFNWLSNHEAALYREWVGNHEYDTYNQKTTVVILKLKSGFEVVGTSGCEDPSKFDENLGHKYALIDALKKLNEFTAFYRAEKYYRSPVPAEPCVRVGHNDTPPFTVQQEREVRRILQETLVEYSTTMARMPWKL